MSGDFDKFPLTHHRKIKKGNQGISIGRVKKTFLEAASGTAGGECMQAVRSSRLYTASVFLTAAAALGASIVFYDGIPWERWPELLVLLILNIYFHCFPATVGENRGYSLGSAVLFAVVALIPNFARHPILFDRMTDF